MKLNSLKTLMVLISIGLIIYLLPNTAALSIDFDYFLNLFDSEPEKPKKESPQENITYGSNYKKTENINGVNTLRSYAGMKYANENGTLLSEAKSLKTCQFCNHSDIQLNIMLDKDFPISKDDIIDYNLTSITVCPRVSIKELNKDISLKSISTYCKTNEETRETECKDVVHESKTLNFKSLSDVKCEVLPFGFDKYIKWGTNSTLIAYTGSGDGRVVRSVVFGSWNNVHDTASGNGFNTTLDSNSITTTDFSGFGFGIGRGFYPIDTSSLPDNAVIVNATFFFFTNETAKGPNSTDFALVHTTQASPTALQLSDYGKCGAIFNPKLLAPAKIVNTTGWWNFSLNATGLDKVNLTGYTQLGVRQYSNDVLDVEPPTTGVVRNVRIFNSESPSGNGSYIDITYTVPLTVTLNKPANNNNSINFSSVTFNCSFIQENYLTNLTLYADYNSSFSKIQMSELSGFSNSSTYTRDIIDDIKAFLDDGIKWNCLAENNNSETDWADSNFTFSNWDVNSSYVGTQTDNENVTLAPNSNGSYTSKIFDSGQTSVWNNLEWTKMFGWNVNDSELPNNQLDERATYEDGANMTGNVLLFHYNNNTDKLENTEQNKLRSLYDFSGSLNYGKLTNITWNATDAKFGRGAIDFDGNNSHVSFDNSFDFNLSDDLSFSSWVNFKNYNDGAIASLICVGGVFIWSQYDFGVLDGFLSMRITNNSLDVYPNAKVNAQIVTDLNVWHHVAATIDYDKSNISLYVDGVLTDNKTWASTIYPEECTTQYFFLGRGVYAFNGVVNYTRLNASLDETAVWNRVLTTEEIEDQFKRGVLELNIDTRTSDDGTDWTPWTYNVSNPSGQINISSRYLQYNTTFKTSNNSFTPYLQSVKIPYDAPSYGIDLKLLILNASITNEVARNSLFSFAVNMTCNGTIRCGPVSLTPRYNYSEATPTTNISSLMNETPFYIAQSQIDNEVVVALANGELWILEFENQVWKNTLIKTYPTRIEAIDIDDADNDGNNEIVIGLDRDAARHLRLLEYNSSTETWQETNISDTLEYHVEDLEIGDADNDGLNEIVIGQERTIKTEPNLGVRLRMYKLVGSVWNETNLTTIADNLSIQDVAIGDVDYDGNNEIVALHSNTVTNESKFAQIIWYNITGTGAVVRDNITGLLTGNDTRGDRMVIDDADNDQQDEIVANFWNDVNGPRIGRLVSIERSNGNWNITNVSLDSAFVDGLDIGDAYNDGLNDIVGASTLAFYPVGSETQMRIYQSTDGSTWSEKNISGGGKQEPYNVSLIWDTAIGDARNNGSNIVLAAYDQYLVLFDSLSGIPVYETVEVFNDKIDSVQLLDVDQDGRKNNIECNLGAGESCKINYTLRATGDVGSYWLIDMISKSDIVNLTNIEIDDVLILIKSIVVNLNYPVDQANTSQSSILFNCTVTDDDSIENVTLYSNFSGTFQANFTNSSGLNGVDYLFNVSNLYDGSYVWNCLGCNNLSCSFNSTNYTLNIDKRGPTYSLNSTNSTQAGSFIKHSLFWEDPFRLSGYVFSFCNGTWTGSACTSGFVNDSFVAMTGLSDWSNVTKEINSSVGLNYSWIIHANDTLGNWNTSDTYVYTSTTADTCTAPCSSPWNINLADNCIITDTQDACGQPVTTYGICGSLSVEGQILNAKNFTIVNDCVYLKEGFNITIMEN